MEAQEGLRRWAEAAGRSVAGVFKIGMRRASAVCAAVLIVACGVADAESIYPENIAAGKLLPGGEAPDKKLCIIEVFHSDTTQCSVIFSTRDRTANLGEAAIVAAESSGVPHKNRVSIVWGADNKTVATHDALNRNSILSVYRFDGTRFQCLKIPDIMAAACTRWGVPVRNIARSRQRPVRWEKDGTLTIAVTARTNGGGKHELQMSLSIPADGPATVKVRE